QSIVQYAVHVLKVNHIIVCGHYNCSGIRAALDRPNPELSLLNKWLMHIKDVYRLYRKEIDALDTREKQVNRLAELNVIEQVQGLAHTSIVQKAWKEEHRPCLHGWIYAMDDGILEQLITLPPGTELEFIYRQADSDE
ncbi:MAG: carbonic anhydrase, partial [Methylocella sp.]